MSKHILVVDDEKAIRNILKDILEREDYKVTEAEDGSVALNHIQKGNFDCIICDIKMPKMDGMELQEQLNIFSPETPMIMISGHADVDIAVETVRKGAFDFIQKPPDLNRLLITIRNALNRKELEVSTKILKRKLSNQAKIIGESDALRKILSMAERVATTDARVLITGDNGTGKELIARHIYENSTRNNTPFIEVNCAAIPSELFESELFGHEKGSFTSAVKQRIGKFELAHGGTLFLDEIGDMSLSAQAKVLRALQEGKISRVGGEKEIKVDVRVLAATNKDLRLEIKEGRFREDLYHRLSVIIVHMPSLNERTDDIPLLVDYFLDLICKEYSIPKKQVKGDAMKVLQMHNWTGNVRELRNVVERLIILSEDVITKEDVENYINYN